MGLLDRLQEQYLNEAIVTLKRTGDILWEIRAGLGDGMGIVMNGFIMSDGRPVREHYQPYCDAKELTSDIYCSIQRQTELELYNGMIDDTRVGIPLIFRVSNGAEYRFRRQHRLSVDIRGARLTGLSTDGKILLPIYKNPVQQEQIRRQDKAREHLIEAARHGDEAAMETLNSEDISMYSAVTKRLMKEDIYSIVDSCFMPQGLECDLYTVIGEITSIGTRRNALTGEDVWDFEVMTNDLPLHVIINQVDLQGDPKVGRRFKGTIWLQGQVVWEKPLPDIGRNEASEARKSRSRKENGADTGVGQGSAGAGSGTAGMNSGGASGSAGANSGNTGKNPENNGATG